jgi:hypothetical protein
MSHPNPNKDSTHCNKCVFPILRVMKSSVKNAQSSAECPRMVKPKAHISSAAMEGKNALY